MIKFNSAVRSAHLRRFHTERMAIAKLQSSRNNRWATANLATITLVSHCSNEDEQQHELI
jgi:hypothetical protein